MADIITGIVEDKQEIKNQLGEYGDVIPAVKKFNENLSYRNIVTRMMVKNMAGSMIWGNPDLAIWGVSKWGAALSPTFILNSALYGQLGNALLGDNGSNVYEFAVIPEGGVYREYFGQSDYIDVDNSTGTLDAQNEQYIMEAGDVLKSTVVTKLRSPLYSVTLRDNASIIVDESAMTLSDLSLGESVFGASDCSIYVTFDDIHWTLIENGGTIYNPEPTVDDILKYRIEAHTALTIANPLEFAINQ